MYTGEFLHSCLKLTGSQWSCWMMGEVLWKEGILVMIWQGYFEAAEANEGTCEGN